MKVNGNTIKPGNVIEHKNGLWVATKTSHVKPGKGGAFAQIELRNLKDGTKLNERFRSSESIEKVILEETPHIFLYKENENLIFMNNDTFEQLSINVDMNLQPFQSINPCGYHGLEVTQIKDFYSNISLEKVKLVVQDRINKNFS